MSTKNISPSVIMFPVTPLKSIAENLNAPILFPVSSSIIKYPFHVVPAPESETVRRALSSLKVYDNEGLFCTSLDVLTVTGYTPFFKYPDLSIEIVAVGRVDIVTNNES